MFVSRSIFNAKSILNHNRIYALRSYSGQFGTCLKKHPDTCNRVRLNMIWMIFLKINRDLHLKLLDRLGEARFISTPSAWPLKARFHLAWHSPSEAYEQDFAVADWHSTLHPTKLFWIASQPFSWGAALIGSAAITVGGYLLVYFGLTPIRTLAEQTRCLAILSLDKRLETEGSPAQLQVLVDQFNDLLNRLEKAYQQLEGFNADVAHELRTPLANIIASSELALRSNDKDENLRDCIGANLEEMHRLSGIVNGHAVPVASRPGCKSPADARSKPRPTLH